MILEKARAAWGGDMPDWVQRLAEEADRTSQNKVAKKLGYTASLISQIINNRYGAGTEIFEQVVRGRLMAETVECPGLRDDITKDVCLSWRDKARDYSGHNALRVQMFRACRRCPRFTGGRA